MDAEPSEVAAGKRKRFDNGARNLLSGLDDFHLNFNDDDQLNFDDNSGDISLFETYDTHLAARLNPHGVTVELRVCFNDKYVTPTFSLPGYRVVLMWRTIHFIEQRFPVTFQKISDGNLQYSHVPIVTHPIFLLQETSYRAKSMRTSRWITSMFRRDGKAFMHWQVRNIRGGKQIVVKMEVHARADGITENFQFIRGAGQGKAIFDDHKYAQLNPNLASNTICDMLYRRGPAVSEPLTEVSTHEYFPERRQKSGYNGANQYNPAGGAD